MKDKNKICNKCLIEKNIEEFGKRKDSKDGLRKQCQECFLEIKRLYKKKQSRKNKKAEQRI